MSGLRKPRFIHYQNPTFMLRQKGKYNGFSVLLSPDIDDDNVKVTITLCVKADAFCRRGARTALEDPGKKSFVVPVVKLPEMLVRLKAKSEGWKFDALEPTLRQMEANAWAWVWKYFL